jgi:peptidoglycan/xylan/chitin deacetylase (PgdA/CDA1 family)
MRAKGVWRLIALFDHLRLPVSLLLNSKIYDHCPEVVAAFRARGDEVVGHGRTNSEHQNDFDEEGETKLIRDVTEAITRHEGKPPQGWLSPGVNPSASASRFD